MSIRIMSAVFECTTMTPTQKLVALALADHCHDDGTEARPGLARLRNKTSLNERTIQRTVRSLLDDGYMVVQRASTPSSPNVYQFVLPGGTVPGGGVQPPPGTKSGGGRLSVVRGTVVRHPNHKEPSYETKADSHSESAPVDLAAVRRRNDEILGRKRPR